MSKNFVPAPDRTPGSRLEDLQAHLGVNEASKTAIDVVSAVIASADLGRIERLQREHAADISGTGPHQGPASEFKYLDIVFWTYWKYRLALDLGLDKTQGRMRILDIGCGGAHLAAVCEHLGHEIVSLDVESPIYHEIATALGVSRTIVKVEPNVTLPELGGKFSLVTAIAITFSIRPRDAAQPHWNLEQWAFFLNDLISNQLRFPGRIWFWLNTERRDGNSVYNPELMKLCKRYGAEVDQNRGVVDWKLQEAVTIHT